MAGNEGSGSPTPSEQDDYHNKESNIDYEEEGAQENEAILDDQDHEPNPQTNDDEENPNAATNDVLTESTMVTENDLVPNQEAAQVSDDTAQPAQLRSNTEDLIENPDAGTNLEGQLGEEVELLVIFINVMLGTPLEL